ncbi:hypothetical protein [Bradyrhizobium sp. ARR65]|uniref:hypothetical protein n=1 Tax=Bradyrhizobium sp. ARR65 TaxID=1040989 RepID=UPI000467CE87|nr:hypothetical protein [Bradyrhizobium sp. ARR65]
MIDIIGSLGVFEHDALSSGLLNGALKDGCDWFLIIEHWAYLQSPLKRLMSFAMANPEHPRLVLQPIEGNLQTRDVIAIEITEQRFGSPPDSALRKDTTLVTEFAQVIDFSSFRQAGRPRR